MYRSTIGAPVSVTALWSGDGVNSTRRASTMLWACSGDADSSSAVSTEPRTSCQLRHTNLTPIAGRRSGGGRHCRDGADRRESRKRLNRLEKSTASTGKLQRHRFRNQALLERFRHQAFDCGPAAVTVAECQIVHVHADELVGLLAIESSPELLRVLDRVLPVLQCVGDAVVEQLRHLPDHLGTEIAPDD